jgi:beta-lactamase superfamily II metal-dependent hydrolase
MPRMKVLRSIAFLLVAFPLSAQEIGKPLPAWSRGMLDIHQLSTGLGNSAFLIFPDGTTMLVDAGAANDGVKMADTDPRPDASCTVGGWIVRYIRRAMAPAAPHLDYALLTHFHADHIGAPTAASLPSKSGTFKLTGIAEVMSDSGNGVAMFGPYVAK